ncbi:MULTISPECIES: hypothetical protein [Citrobacter]|uniref:hypothetical protein n=1 Tax=Citrobacter TaxID=544 RepID=UPI0023AB0CC7|nr:MULTISPECIES: hypothetical protein [Citrobacter]MDM2998975.1 hypothetical protein [Citrobacter sp. CK192]MDM3019805.1 hypothetical protein [Citrobacter sp. CK193]WEE19122.1 hypothetical protein PX343_09535 [Citrobacter koseri]
MTNNQLTGLGAGHPANSPLTIDRLTNVRDVLHRNLKYSNGGSMDYIIADAVKAIDELLVSRGTEPVFFIEVEGDDWVQAGRIPGSTFDFNDLPDGIVNLYTAAPAPVEPLTDEQIDDVLDSRGNILYVIADKRERLRMFAREILRAAMGVK